MFMPKSFIGGYGPRTLKSQVGFIRGFNSCCETFIANTNTDAHPSSLLDSKRVQVDQTTELFEARGTLLALSTRKGRGAC
jgi:hypothetical protein